MKFLALSVVGLAFMSGVAQASTEEHHHFPAVFVGGTSFDGETEFTYGVEYEYKFSKRWGAGAVFEKTNDAHHGDGTTVSLASLYLHPWKELRVGAGFGREKVGGAHPHKENLARVSVSYDFHVGEFGLAPTIAVDFIDGETATVFGVAFVKSF